MKKYSSLALMLLLSLASCSPSKDVPSTEAGDSTLSQSVEATTQEATLPETTPIETTKVETTPAETGPVKVEKAKFTIFCKSYTEYYVVDPWCPIIVEDWRINGDYCWHDVGSFVEIVADATVGSGDPWKVDRLISVQRLVYREVIETFGIPEVGQDGEAGIQVYKSDPDTYLIIRTERGYAVFHFEGPTLSICEGIIPFNFTQDGILTAEAMERFLNPQKATGLDVAISAKNLTEGLKDASTASDVVSEEFVAEYMAFSEKLTNVMLDQAEEGSNLLISPLSVMTSISMAANGAANDTLAQMEAALGENVNIEEINKGLQSWYAYCGDKVADTLTFANSIWLNEGSGIEEQIREDFLRKSINTLDAGIYSTPFDAQGLEDVNNWCRSKTFGMIPNMLDRFEDGDVIVLLNTLAFDAQWLQPFDPGATRIREFTDSKGNIEDVEMMCGFADIDLYVSDSDRYPTGVMKSFGNTPFTFGAFLPDRGESAEDLLRRLDAEKLRKLFQAWKKWGPQEEPEMEIYMPKFNYSAVYDLADPLKALGIKDAFDLERADFSNMTGDQPLCITRAIHKTSIELNERGTRIAAGSTLSGGYSDSIDFDRPFVYVIYETNYGLPIFIGLVNHIN